MARQRSSPLGAFCLLALGACRPGVTLEPRVEGTRLAWDGATKTLTCGSRELHVETGAARETTPGRVILRLSADAMLRVDVKWDDVGDLELASQLRVLHELMEPAAPLSGIDQAKRGVDREGLERMAYASGTPPVPLRATLARWSSGTERCRFVLLERGKAIGGNPSLEAALLPR